MADMTLRRHLFAVTLIIWDHVYSRTDLLQQPNTDTYRENILVTEFH